MGQEDPEFPPLGQTPFQPSKTYARRAAKAAGIRQQTALRWTHPKTFQKYAIDVTVISPLQEKYIRRGSAENGYAAKLAENYKLAHYKEAMSVEKPEEKFIPIAIETFGRSGRLTQDFLRDSCKHLLHRDEELRDARSQLNRILWQGNAAIALGALRVDQLENPLVPVFSFERSMRPR